MKAPISKKIQAILSDQAGSQELVSAIVNDKSQGTLVRIGGKQYELQRIVGYHRN